MVAVKVVVLPKQIVEALALIETLGVKEEPTAIVIPGLVTNAGVAHAAFEVISTVTTSPFDKVDELKKDELVPTLVDPIFH